MDRNLNFLLALPKLSDEILIDVNEVASITGFSKYTIRHRRIKDFPSPLSGSHRLRWQLGHIRQWIRSSTGNRDVGSPAERNASKGEHLWGMPDEIENTQQNDAQKVSDRTCKTKAKVGHPRLPSDLHLQSTK